MDIDETPKLKADLQADLKREIEKRDNIQAKIAAIEEKAKRETQHYRWDLAAQNKKIKSLETYLEKLK